MTKFISARANFRGSLAGKSIEDFRNLDYEKENSDERLNILNEKIKEVESFLEQYFFTKEKDEYDNGEFEHLIEENDEKVFYKYNPNSTDELSEDINICKTLENFGSYLLNSKDIKRDKQCEYTIMSEEDFKKQLSKEMSTGVGSEENVVLDTRPTNDYTNLELKPTKKDLHPHMQDNKYGIREKDLELAKVLNDYETMREYIRNEMQKLKNGERASLTLYQMKSLLSSLLGDMCDAKRMILGVRNQAKRLGDESPFNDYSVLEYWNEEHIKQCLKFCKLTNSLDPSSEMSHIGYDLNNAINKLKKDSRLDETDLEIIDCYNSNYTLEQIGLEVNMSKVAVHKRINKICLRITEVI